MTSLPISCLLYVSLVSYNLNFAFYRENNLYQDVQTEVKKLIAEAKTYAAEGELYKSIKIFKKAYKIAPTEKILSRIRRVEEAIAAEKSDSDEEDENLGLVELDNGMVIYKKLVERLYPHQACCLNLQFS
ncbi:DNA excision repair protein ERCC-6-like [Ciona intestinalis]